MGISHSWNGTVLTITSDSGTSSADLKGDIGIRGPQGATGDQYKPQYGVDYFTDAEKQEFIGEVDAHIEANKEALFLDEVRGYLSENAVSEEQVADYVAENAAPASHVDDKNNPHGVTAEQAGARPITWMPTADEVGARPNTWIPTAADVGAVPTSQLNGLHMEIATVPTSGSLRFMANGQTIVTGRLNGGAASSNALYVITAYSTHRAPIVTEISKGNGITLSTSGDNTNGWYVTISNGQSNATAGLMFVGGMYPVWA